MSLQTEAKKNISCIHIIGPRLIQNQLISIYLNSLTGAPCITHKKSITDFKPDREQNSVHLVLYDFGDITAPVKSDILPEKPDLPNMLTALFNFSDKLGIETEKKAYDEGIRGVFYPETDLELFKKGVLMICNGELWFSRKTLSIFADKKNSNNSKNSTREILTGREKDILLLISLGMSNKDVAKKLFISEHTVKTHLYNVFQKIKVTNRMQAALWANQFLS